MTVKNIDYTRIPGEGGTVCHVGGCMGGVAVERLNKAGAEARVLGGRERQTWMGVHGNVEALRKFKFLNIYYIALMLSILLCLSVINNTNWERCHLSPGLWRCYR